MELEKEKEKEKDKEKDKARETVRFEEKNAISDDII